MASGEQREGSIIVPGLDREVTADDFDKAIAAGLRRKDYLRDEMESRKARGQAYTLAEAELEYHHLALHAVRVQADELRGNDTPLSLLEEAKSFLAEYREEMGTAAKHDMRAADLDEFRNRVEILIRRLT